MYTNVKVLEVENVALIKPLFEEYMWFMKGFIEVGDVTSWRNRAMEYLALYEAEKEWRIHALTSGGEVIIGFVLINQDFRFILEGQKIADFYIKEEHRGLGLGEMLAVTAFDRCRGSWEVCVTAQNKAGSGFWRKVISNYTGDTYHVNRNECYDGHGYTFSNA